MKIAVFVLPDVELLDFSVIMGAFSSPAVSARHELLVITDGVDITSNLGSLSLNGKVVTDCASVSLGEGDILIIPGYKDFLTPIDEKVRIALQRFAAARTIMASMCTGAFALGYAGLLDGRRVTTHWSALEGLATLFPLATVLEDVIYCDESTILTSAGVFAGIDLCLYIIRQIYGSVAAKDVSAYLVAPLHRPAKQRQRSLVPQRVEDDESFAAALEWARDNLTEISSSKNIADKANISVRTLHRKFHQIIGITPGVWIRTQKISLSREILENTVMSIEEVARHCGYSDVSNFRDQFKRETNHSPREYRTLFHQVP